jgi:hypothetical protein
LSIFLFPFAFIRFYSLFDKGGSTKENEAKGLPGGFAGSDLNFRLFANAHFHFRAAITLARREEGARK